MASGVDYKGMSGPRATGHQTKSWDPKSGLYYNGNSQRGTGECAPQGVQPNPVMAAWKDPV